MRARISATTIESPDPRRLASFYEQLLGWERVEDHPVWVRIKPDPDSQGLSFSMAEDFVPPVWPAESGAQQMMMHLDIGVDDLDVGVATALDLGATLAEFQPQPDVRVLLDPDGHPFCLFRTTF